MAKEIWHDYTSGATLYACRFNLTGEVFLSDGSATEVWGTEGHTADDYDVSLTERGVGGHYSGDFDAVENIADGTYRVVVYVQAGANPVDGDDAIAQGLIYWKDSASVTLSSLIDIMDALEAKIDIIDTNMDTLIQKQSTVLNVYPEETRTISRGNVIGIEED